MTLPLLATLPWLLLAVWAAWRIHLPRGLPTGAEGKRAGASGRRPPPPQPLAPLVSVVVPARNEEETIEDCLRSLTRSRYPAFEIIVVDDRSEDRTGELARGVEPGRSRRLRVVEGQPLPEGWVGKPWACWQGFQEAEGELVLFTDADTVHGPDLLERAVAALEEDDVAALSVVGRQRLETFWEKVVQPQVFALLSFRFPDLREPIRPGRCRHAVASGQFVLVRRGPYRAVGGHEALRGEVVEDLRLAQRLCRAGYRLSVREGEDVLATRMYRSLGHMVEGWTKNLALGSAQTLPPRLRRTALPAMLASGVVFWLLPPIVLGTSLLTGVGDGGLRLWSTLVVGMSVLFWGGASRRMRIHPLWGLLYPLGSAVGAWIFARSWLRGTTVEWKGRSYEVDEELLLGG